MTEQSASGVLHRLREIFVARDPEPEPEIPDRCPNCGLRVGITMVKDSDGTVVRKSWSCLYCKNSATSDPECDPGEARDRMRRQRDALAAELRALGYEN